MEVIRVKYIFFVVTKFGLKFQIIYVNKGKITFNAMPSFFSVAKHAFGQKIDSIMACAVMTS